MLESRPKSTLSSATLSVSVEYVITKVLFCKATLKSVYRKDTFRDCILLLRNYSAYTGTLADIYIDIIKEQIDLCSTDAEDTAIMGPHKFVTQVRLLENHKI